MIDTHVLMDILNIKEIASSLPLRLESWVSAAVEQAQCKVKEHTIAFAVSGPLFKEYQARINTISGTKTLSRGLNEYLEMNHGRRIRKSTTKGDFFLVPYKFNPKKQSWTITDRYDRKLLDLTAHLLNERRFADRPVLVGCNDRDTLRDLWDSCIREVPTARDRLSMAEGVVELEEVICDH